MTTDWMTGADFPETNARQRVRSQAMERSCTDSDLDGEQRSSSQLVCLSSDDRYANSALGDRRNAFTAHQAACLIPTAEAAPDSHSLGSSGRVLGDRGSTFTAY